MPHKGQRLIIFKVLLAKRPLSQILLYILGWTDSKYSSILVSLQLDPTSMLQILKNMEMREGTNDDVIKQVVNYPIRLF